MYMRPRSVLHWYYFNSSIELHAASHTSIGLKCRKSVCNRPIYVDYGYRIANYGYMYGDFSRERHITLYSVSTRILEVRYSCYYILLLVLAWISSCQALLPFLTPHASLFLHIYDPFARR